MGLSRSEVPGFKSPMTHRNFCNHNLITNVALGIFMTMRANKNLYSLSLLVILFPTGRRFQSMVKTMSSSEDSDHDDGGGQYDTVPGEHEGMFCCYW